LKGAMSELLLWNASAGQCQSVDPRLHPGVEATCCDAGILLPAFERRFLFVIPWLLILCWVFSGVALGSEVFMTAIEIITSREKSTTVTVNGLTKKFHVAVWNPTVANLTLMALGSSAPEILLNVIEVLTGDFYAGDLGPSTIVGSAAFNLMCITAVCIMCLPPGETRTLDNLGVFLTTSAYSVFAYIWLLIIVMLWTPNIITVTEGILTVALLVVLVIHAFVMDRYTTMGQSDNYVTRVLGSGEEVIDPEEAAQKIEKLRRQSGGLSHNKRMDAARIASFLRPKSRAHYRSRLSARRSRTSKPLETQMVDLTVVDVKRTPSKNAKKRKADRVETKEQKEERRAQIKAPNGILAWREDMVSVMEDCGSVTLHVDRINGTAGEVTVKYHTKDQSATAGADYEAVSGILTFQDGEETKSIEIKIIDDDAFEKTEEFTVILSCPTGGARFDSVTDGKSEQDICTVVIINDDEARGKLSEALALVSVFDRDRLRLARANFLAQIKDAVDPGDYNGLLDRIYFVLNVPWRILFALVPPPALWGGWPCFFGSLIGIGCQVVLINDFASQMGCQMHIKASVTAITFVALGTSLPDTFASMQAARDDKSADNSIGNVTGSNSVNVFFGLGLPWLIGAIYWSSVGPTDEWKERYPKQAIDYPEGGFVVLSGDLGFSVVVFTCCACVTLALILVRRYVGDPPGELGGHPGFARACAFGLLGLWVLYVALSALSAYGYISVMQDV